MSSANDRDCLLNARSKVERLQHAHAVSLNQEPVSQRLLALDELRREAVPIKSCRRGEAGYRT
jgi:predicted transcriptional regulator